MCYKLKLIFIINNSSGTVMRRWKPCLGVGSRGDIEISLRVSHLSVSNDQKTRVYITNETIHKFETFWQEHARNRLSARDDIVASFCPQVCFVLLDCLHFFFLICVNI